MVGGVKGRRKECSMKVALSAREYHATLVAESLILALNSRAIPFFLSAANFVEENDTFGNSCGFRLNISKFNRLLLLNLVVLEMDFKVMWLYFFHGLIINIYIVKLLYIFFTLYYLSNDLFFYN